MQAVLCLHGFTGTPFEIRPVADELTRLGYHVESPTLAGHGTDLAALEATRWPDWLRSAEQAFDALCARTPGRIAVVGFSMGGLLALRLGRSRGERIAALAVLSAPLRLRPVQVRGIRILGRIPRALRLGPLRAVPKLRLFGANVSDRQVRRDNPALAAMPLVGLQSLLELMAEVRDDLNGISAPALVVHGRRDRTVPFSASLELADRLDALIAAAAGKAWGAGAGAGTGTGTDTGVGADAGPAATVERLWLDRSGHQVGIDVERDVLSRTVGHFLATRARW